MTDAEVFDKQELLEELDGDWEFLEESLDMLDTDAPELLEQIRAGIESDDAESVRVSAHTIKSMVGNFCAPGAVNAALNVEKLGSSGDLAGCAAGFPLLQEQVSRLQHELRKLLDEAE